MASRSGLVTPLVIDQDKAPKIKLRPLGTFEEFRTILHDLGYHNNVCLLGSYHNIRLTHHLLLHALEHAIFQHPALSVQVSNAGAARPYFVRLPFIDLNEVVEYVDIPGMIEQQPARLDDFLSAQHSVGFHDKKKPLWRVVVLKYVDEDSNRKDTETNLADIAFIWHHVIGDGKSGLAVHTSILQGLISPSCSSGSCLIRQSDPSNIDGRLRTRSDIVEPPIKELFPSLEQLFLMPASRSMKFKNWLNDYLGPCLPLLLRSQAKSKVQKWSGAPYHDEAPIKTLIRHIIVPKLLTSQLVKLCRIKRTTITAFLQALIGRAISRHYNHMWSLRCATAISMRRFMDTNLNIGEDEMGLWVSAFHFELKSRELSGTDGLKEGFWVLAKKNRKRIRNEIRKADTDLGIGGLRFIPDFRQNLTAKRGRKREDSFAVTNLGVFDGALVTDRIDEQFEEESKIARMVFSQSCHVNGSALQFCITSVRHGEMIIGISWQEGTVPIKETEWMVKSLKADLIVFAEEFIKET